jgi:hypothetical protein
LAIWEQTKNIFRQSRRIQKGIEIVTSSKLVMALATLMAASPAVADLQSPPSRTLIPACNFFEVKPDGSWTPKSPVILNLPNGQISMLPGTSFRRGTLFLGMLDLGAQLERQCRGSEVQS